jgi:hypothetical protein
MVQQWYISDTFEMDLPKNLAKMKNLEYVKPWLGLKASYAS